jgi:hypothetical protein
VKKKYLQWKWIFEKDQQKYERKIKISYHITEKKVYKLLFSLV